MPIEPPDPHGKLQDTLAALCAAHAQAPHDARIVAALGHVAAAVAVLQLPAPRDAIPSGA